MLPNKPSSRSTETNDLPEGSRRPSEAASQRLSVLAASSYQLILFKAGVRCIEKSRTRCPFICETSVVLLPTYFPCSPWLKRLTRPERHPTGGHQTYLETASSRWHRMRGRRHWPT
ncbi:hypothetical protein PISMIDRAFT_222947 [Pisolithus microcarpus 441]|uniref:Uncharacterized protein n=1 Tax=Pisolithus microcarpus 441 TaxID=765257 RepID=A0A0C9ZC76_9AGAM|nr:hypothetical protein PISMIDRAFT_222947 [Pisolithus microcarpus 441]